MSDESAPDEETAEELSKRQRQKQRKQAKREAEARARRKARLRKLAVFAGIALLLAGVVGVFVARELAERAEQRELAAQADQLAEAAGCTTIEQVPDMGAGHFAGEEQLAVSPPDAVYQTRPATSGTHMGQVALTGVYDKAVDERLLVHNLEHGYVVFWHDEQADDDEVAALRDWAQERIDDGMDKIVVAEYHDGLAEGDFAAVAWHHRQVCETFDPDVFRVFLNELHDSPDVPEPAARAHVDPGDQGVLDPDEDDGPLLFPPLGEDAPPAPEEGGETGDFMDQLQDPMAPDEPDAEGPDVDEPAGPQPPD